jgi:DNA topoisomerase-6 subunit B
MPQTRSVRRSGRQAELFGSAAPAPRRARTTKPARKKAKTKAKPSKKTTVTKSAKTKKQAAVKAAKPAKPVRRRKSAAKPAREDARTMAARQRDISVSEFFTKNRHLLGFDNPQKALLTAVKEAVDNSLDACEEAGILPDLEIEIIENGDSRFRVNVQDNGPGIVRQQIPKIFGKLLYGSKFHRLKQQRGQQGIGISAAGMYGQLTTGRPVRIISRTGKRKPAHLFLIAVDTKKNAPVIQKDTEVEWDSPHGTRVEIELEAVYKKGRRSVDDYVEQTALANPHARIHYLPPKDEPVLYERVSEALPKEAKEIKPHPYGVELGLLLRMMKETKSRNLRGMLTSEFSRVSPAVADQICAAAGVKAEAKPSRLSGAQVELVFHAIPKVKIMAPPTACLAPIGEELLQRGLEQRVEADFFVAVTRPPAVYRGNPFQIEVGLAYGGGLSAEEPVDLYRYANRVPLQYQQSACAISKSMVSVDWKKYGLQQARGALPAGPMLAFVHIASVWVPFTSESKEAVASYPEITKELRLALMEAGRRVGAFVRRRKREADEFKKRSYIEKYIPAIGEALQEILGYTDARRERTVKNLKTILERSRKL